MEFILDYFINVEKKFNKLIDSTGLSDNLKQFRLLKNQNYVHLLKFPSLDTFFFQWGCRIDNVSCDR